MVVNPTTYVEAEPQLRCFTLRAWYLGYMFASFVSECLKDSRRNGNQEWLQPVTGFEISINYRDILTGLE